MRKIAINKLNDLFGRMQSNEPETGFIAALFKVFEKAIARNRFNLAQLAAAAGSANIA